MIEDGDRNWVSQTGYSSGYHSILLGNTWRNNVPRRHNSGENMYEAGGATWHGPVAGADATSLTVTGAPFENQKLANEFVLILDGRGLGQYRRMTGNTADTLSVAPAWDVVPDASTLAMVGRAYVETLWIDNEENTANWTGFWGNNFGHVVDSHALRNGGVLPLGLFSPPGCRTWTHSSGPPWTCSPSNTRSQACRRRRR